MFERLLIAFMVSAMLVTTADAKSRSVSFNQDVAPILFKHCVPCHRPSMFAPMSLIRYEEVRPWSRAIKAKVASRAMPPWFADPAVGSFKNDPRLTPADIVTVTDWVDAGSPRGAGFPPDPPTLPDGWSIGKPDAVFSVAQSNRVPTAGTIPYRYYRIHADFNQDRWIRSFEIRPDAGAPVHHVIASASTHNSAPIASEQRPGAGLQLGGSTPNKPGIQYGPDVARRLPAHSDIILEVHYTPNGTVAPAGLKLGIVWAPEPPRIQAFSVGVMNSTFTIPPFVSRHEVIASRRFDTEVVLLAMMPHMHLRGRSMVYTAKYPDSTTEVLLRVPKFDFSWQLTYELAEPRVLPRGTIVDVAATYDNSSGNKSNPDPSVPVKWGEQTWDEMMVGWLTVGQVRPVSYAERARQFISRLWDRRSN